MKMPETTELPYFAYGPFKPKEPAHYKIEIYLEKSSEYKLKGHMDVNDGLPMLDFDWDGRVEGFLLYFKDPSSAKEAYKIISDYYSPFTHTWQTNKSPDIKFNSVVRVKPRHKDYDYFSNNNPIECWSAKDDPLFSWAMRVIGNGIKKYHDKQFDKDEGNKFDWESYYEIQMKYLLLWSVLERFMSLKVSLNVGKDIHGAMNIRSIFSTKYLPFGKACSKYITEELHIAHFDNPNKYISSVQDIPNMCIEFFHSLRTNLIHRGKSAEFDGERLRKSFLSLYSIVRDTLKEEGLFRD